MYSDAYFDAYSVHHSTIPGYAAGRAVAETVANARMDRIMRVRSSGRLLDVGCAGGHFLAVARARGFEVLGVEYNRSMAEYAAKTYDLEVRHGDFLDLQIPGVFDVVHLEDVLEHVLDPASVLSKLRQLVARNGYLVIDGPLERQPNLSLALLELNLRLRRPDDPEMAPAHIWQFSIETQRRLVEGSGFRETEHWIYHAPVLAAPTTPSPMQTLRRRSAHLVGQLSAWLSRRRSMAFLGIGDRALVFYQASGDA
jgi:SAM-dependent methyltransferase